MLSHDNILYNAATAIDDFFSNIPDDLKPPSDFETRVVSYLPLSHIAGY